MYSYKKISTPADIAPYPPYITNIYREWQYWNEWFEGIFTDNATPLLCKLATEISGPSQAVLKPMIELVQTGNNEELIKPVTWKDWYTQLDICINKRNRALIKIYPELASCNHHMSYHPNDWSKKWKHLYEKLPSMYPYETENATATVYQPIAEQMPIHQPIDEELLYPVEPEAPIYPQIGEQWVYQHINKGGPLSKGEPASRPEIISATSIASPSETNSSLYIIIAALVLISIGGIGYISFKSEAGDKCEGSEIKDTS
jgi:hypothetical protein